MKKFPFLFVIVFIAVVCFAVFFFQGKEKKAQNVSELVAVTVPEVREEIQENIKKSDLSFDIVRVEKDGTAVIAGRALPNQTFHLMDADTVLSEIKANETGEWVFLPTDTLSAGDHELWLRGNDKQNKQDSEVVLVSVPEKPAETMVVLLTNKEEDVVVMQKPDEEALEFSIETARYQKNRLFVSGKSTGTGKVTLYVNNKPVGKADIQNNAFQFKTEVQMMPEVKYVLRVDRTDDFEKVVSRAEVPFSVEKGVDKSVKIVKGDNLWTIARQVYGSGFDYTIIYRANKNQIKNPNLIYPEQVFVLPVKPVK